MLIFSMGESVAPCCGYFISKNDMLRILIFLCYKVKEYICLQVSKWQKKEYYLCSSYMRYQRLKCISNHLAAALE